MLILSRRPGESIIIDGKITVRIMRVEKDIVKLGIEAPDNVPVHREEVYEEIQKNNQGALHNGNGQAPRLASSPESSPHRRSHP